MTASSPAVHVLGTGAADGWPNPFCDCHSCNSARAAGTVRAQTCALVGDFLLDCGPETLRTAERAGISLRGVRHVLLTHDHPDHTAPAFLLYRSWVAGDAPLDVVGPATVIASARQWLAPDTHVAFHEVSPGDVLEMTGGTVRVLAAAHARGAVLYDVHARAHPGPLAGGSVQSDRVDAELAHLGPTAQHAVRVLYATDTGPLPAETVAATAGAAYEVVLLEQTFGDFTDHGTDHLDLPSFTAQVRRLREVGAITNDTDVVAVHLSHHNPPQPELADRLAAIGARMVDDGTRLGDSTQPSRTLVIGGARSGKSSEAERILIEEGGEVTYVATSYPRSDDPEWVERVRLHRAQRPAEWATVETLDIVGLLGEDGGPLLIDCLTLWLTRVMDTHDAWADGAWEAGAEAAVLAEVEALTEAWRTTNRRVVAVTNEVGQGIVPAEPSLRRFRDEMGRLNAAIAAASPDVRWCIAGRVVSL
ncbi:bifunctional adenosylcobinamide kinase/adenosylcobinamide-phosphate guanylyltransferase [Nocardioides sp. AE5]|uniref:bifunctional adenosylcobinamide kinase/adenosylcobinamide-phosphate guanylyltransferase n=1 Tax=Nocardioides sp. AE5 TaxID=2962573 RepID=UPI00288188DB|nr:bifunctional adenosylcobinamide kinase/adenosylcobinamide-phosphate guanylyltransferase [Nocardioides sp. AE5]MDT0201760.1 bifunctional adenosylcobinamide kinase/adenosylcobinamide-phosphate guanylyltransferase [Nocardioides sp. AE5]